MIKIGIRLFYLHRASTTQDMRKPLTALLAVV